MMDKIKLYVEKYNALVLRQRIIFLLTFLSAIYMFFYFFYFFPVENKQKKLFLENAYLASLYEEAVQVQEDRNKQDKALDIVKLNNKLYELKDEVAVLNLELKEYFSIASSTDDLMSIVKDLVGTSQGLTLEKMALLPAESIKLGLSVSSLDSELMEETVGELALKDERDVMVYKHKIYIEVKGDYRSLTYYLKKIESLEWGLFVQSVAYKVEDYPASMATIVLYSLSLGGGEYAS